MRHDVRKPVILATGFSVFPGAPENPTAWVIGELARTHWQPDGAMLATAILPVRHGIWDEMTTLIARERPDAVIGFGLSAKATGFTLEATARNQLGLNRPDAAGIVAASDRLTESGQPTFPSALPLTEIEATLRRHDVPVAPSDDAGDYICNLFFYRLMEHRAKHGTPPVGGFIHVPYLTEQLPLLERAGLPTAHLVTMTRGQLLEGTRAILTVVADAIARVHSA
jgi:pyroglutamyl-peptidase